MALGAGAGSFSLGAFSMGSVGTMSRAAATGAGGALAAAATARAAAATAGAGCALFLPAACATLVAVPAVLALRWAFEDKTTLASAIQTEVADDTEAPSRAL